MINQNRHCLSCPRSMSLPWICCSGNYNIRNCFLLDFFLQNRKVWMLIPLVFLHKSARMKLKLK